MVFGCPAKLLRHHLEVRGLGILNIKDLFGVTAIRERKRIDVVVRLVEESSTEIELDRMGLDDRFHAILAVSIPELVIPVRPGRDMASILEVAARNELLKNAGHHAARELFGAIERKVSAQTLASAAGKPRDSAAGHAGGPRDSEPRGSHVSSRSQESQFGMRPVRLPRPDESGAPPPVVGGPPRGRR
jgi:HPr kinase/phosphorylase